MNPHPFPLIVAALATWQAIEVWHHSSLTSGLRARSEAGVGFWADLSRCAFCLSNWVGPCCVLILSLAASWWPLAWCAWPAAIIVHGLAVARLANLGNDLTKAYCRTPDHGDVEGPH
jgi:hypothetical protein